MSAKDTCTEAFEKWHGFSVSPDMDIGTEIAWANWLEAWNTAIRSATHACDRLAWAGKGVRGQVDRAFAVARDDVRDLECRAASSPANTALTGREPKEHQ